MVTELARPCPCGKSLQGSLSPEDKVQAGCAFLLPVRPHALPLPHFPDCAGLAYMSLPPGSPQASILLKIAEHPSGNRSGSVSLRASLLCLPVSTAREEPLS